MKTMIQHPRYTDKTSAQSLREGLAEYYALNPHLTPPETQPPEFAKVLLAHDVGHVIYGYHAQAAHLSPLFIMLRIQAPAAMRLLTTLCRQTNQRCELSQNQPGFELQDQTFDPLPHWLSDRQNGHCHQ